MTSEELQAIVTTLRQVGIDHRIVEAKKAQRALPQRLWETLSAFANSPGGGILILGLDEEKDFAATGVENAGKLQSDLASLCDQMEPPLRPLIEVHTLEDQQVVTAEIPEVPADHKPCYYKGAGAMSGAFLRVADGDRRLTEYEVHLFWEARRPPRHDRQVLAEKTVTDLDADRLRGFVNRVRQRPRFRDWTDEKILVTLRVLAATTNRDLHPTLAGYLSFGNYPQDEFPGLHLSVVRYPTTTPGVRGARGERLEDNVKVEGNLAEMLLDAVEAIRRNLHVRTVVRGLYRVDELEYPLELLREAVVNALAHRDYSPQALGSPVQVRLFPDRMEVENPGGLFGPVTVERLGEPGLMATRNDSLVRVLEDLPAEQGRLMCENRGTGVVAMLASLRQAGLSPPAFEDRRTMFLLRVSNAVLLDEEALQWLNQSTRGVRLSDSQRLALAFAWRTGRLDHADYRRLSPNVDSSQVRRELSQLTSNGLLLQQGARRWTFYVVAEAHRVLRPTPKRQDRREELTALLGEHESLSAIEIADQLKLTPQGAKRWLRVLREEGIVRVTTESPRSPNARYALIERG